MLSTYDMKIKWIPLIVCLFTVFTACQGNCIAPPAFSFAFLQDEFVGKEDFPVNSNVSYVCRPGYTRIRGMSNVITCLSDSTWSTLQDFCQRVNCGNPGEPENGALDTDKVVDFLFGSNVTYTCNVGYKMESRRNFRVCQADGTWSNEVPVCSIQICPPPHSITDGRFDPDLADYEYQNTVKYSCDKGLSLIGTDTITCTAFGNWSADAPQCKEISCENPVVKNAERLSGFTGPYTLNSAVSFQCSPGFTMTGASLVVCNASSMWNPPLPSCNESTGNPGNGSTGNHVNAIVGGVIAGIVGLLALAVFVWWCVKKRGDGGDLCPLGKKSDDTSMVQSNEIL